MKTLTIALSAFVAFVVTAQQRAVAIEPLSSEKLASHCDYYRKAPDIDGLFCVRYIQGFIDGAVAADERITLKQVLREKRSTPAKLNLAREAVL